MALRTNIVSADAQTDHAAQHNEVNTAVLALQDAGRLLAVLSNTTSVNVASSGSTPVDVDATHGAITFTAPTSGKILVLVQAACIVPNFNASMYWALRESSSQVGNSVFMKYSTGVADSLHRMTATFYLTGVSAGSHTYKFAHHRGVGDSADGTTNWGGSGPLVIQVWSAP